MDSKLREEHAALNPVHVPYDAHCLWAMLDAQRKLHGLYTERFPEQHRRSRTERLITLADAIAMEVAELKEWLPWKYWKAGYLGELTEDEVNGVIEELVDILHFVLETFLELGISRERTIAGYYLAKNAVNRRRQEEGY